MTPPPMNCPSCDKPLGRKNRTGYCNRHAKQSPEYREKLAAAQRRVQQADPTIRLRKSKAMREIAATPEWRERNAEQCRRRRLWEQGVAGRTAESNIAQGRTFSARHGYLSWCPPELVETARALRRTGVPLDETKRLIAEQHERDMRRFRASLGG